MKSFISKLGVSLVAFALVVAPTLVLAQEALTASIDSPADGTEVTINTAVTFVGSADGGQSPYSYVWNFGEGSPVSGSQVDHTYTTTGSKTVTFTVEDIQGNGPATETITVNVVEEVSDLEITNIQVTDKTSTTATITWTTNRPATSRVIYDTVSHSDISVESAPKYGYAESTTLDENKVIEHTVTLSGLQPSTQYFYRVLSAE